MNKDQFLELVHRYMQANPYSRRGQAIFNVAWMQFGQKLQHMVAMDNDPYYTDDRIELFIDNMTKQGLLTA